MSTPNSKPQGQYPDSWPLTPDKKALAHAERLKFQRPDDLATSSVIPDEGVRSKTAELFDRLEGVKTPEQVEAINKIANQYESSVTTWTKLNIPTEGIQKKQEVIAWLNSLSAKTLENLAAYGEVRLKFIPPVKALELLKDIKGFSHWEEGWENVGAKGWEFGLTTDAEDLPLDESIYYLDPANKKAGTPRNEDMVNLYEKKYQEQGMDLMPQEAYVPSAADAMAQGKVLDRKFYTAFKRPQGVRCLPLAVLGGDRVYLYWSDPDDSNSRLRTRPWVRGGKV